MLQILDLAGLAESIDTPYIPRPLASLPGLDVLLVVAEGPASWFRQVSFDELLLVLEGVVTLDAPQGRLVLNEGELASADRNARHHIQSGMRTTMVLFREVKPSDESNGHHSPDTGLAGLVEKKNAAVAVLSSGAFSWLGTGSAGAYDAHATRLVGASAPYTVPAGALAAVVYRGVLNYEAVDGDGRPVGDGTVVGSQMLVAGSDTRLTFTSERGATLLLLVRHGAPLPQPAAPAGTPGPERSDHPEP
jgi:hypothetical protein